jgi:hypothetical protein
MKVFVTQGIVTAQAETEQEIQKLFSFKSEPVKRTYTFKAKEVKPFRRAEVRKTCSICQNRFKRMAYHQRLKHGIGAPNTTYFPGGGKVVVDHS